MLKKFSLSTTSPNDFPAQTLSELLSTTPAQRGGFGSGEEYFWVDAVDNVLIVAVTNTDGTILYANNKFCAISGYSQAELIGANHRILNSGHHERGFFAQMYRTIKAGHTWRGEICNRSKSGQLYWVATTIIPRLDQNGEVTHYVACRFDISEQKLAQQELAKAANTDSLTGLSNRSAFRRYFESILTNKETADCLAALAMVDIDNFKDVNDVYGHQVGDKVLTLISQRISECLSDGDLIGRFGGDEICVLFSSVLDKAELKNRLENIQNVVRQAIEFECATISVCASIGVVVYPENGRDVEDLFKRVDMALYLAKQRGRNRYEFYTSELQDRVTTRISTQEEARSGLLEGKFTLFYQPIYSSDKRCIESMEALLRWNHPQRGLLTPGQFWDVFEDLRLTTMLGTFVRAKAIENAKSWKANGIPFGKISLNTTSADFIEPNFASRLKNEIESNGLSIGDISIEVTEGMFLGRQASHIRDEIRRLHEYGFEIAFDDFGTGFASLTHLKELPLDRIKIDRSFIKDIENNDADLKIVKGIVALAHSLGLVVTVEGIETKNQLEIMMNLRVESIQGYIVSKPLPFLEVSAASLELISPVEGR